MFLLEFVALATFENKSPFTMNEQTGSEYLRDDKCEPTVIFASISMCQLLHSMQ